MSLVRRLTFAVALALAAAGSASSAEIRLTPAEISGLDVGGAGPGTSGMAGIRTTVLAGDPTKPGLYTIELRVPAGMSIAAHRHADERTATVVSGTWYFGYGDKADPGLVKALGPGGFYSEPAGLPHFAMTRGEPATVYITGVGPTDTRYVRAADDPRR